MNLLKKDIIFSDVKKLKGVGKQLASYLKNKKIEKVKDILLNLPFSETDRSKLVKIDKLETGKIQTIKVKVTKLNFPRIRNLPNKIICKDETGKIEITYFNSREGYLRKIFPINEYVVISGKVSFFKNNYQITNPDYVTLLENKSYVQKLIPKYSLTKGINEKKYRTISDQVIDSLPDIEDWYEDKFLKEQNFLSWKNNIIALHKTKDAQNNLSNSYRRLVLDEICANFLVLSNNRKKIKKRKKTKYFDGKNSEKILKKLQFNLTKSQNKVLSEINSDLKSKTRMFRILQGDVGSGKTIVSFLGAANVVESGGQCALMAPTEILARQHYNFAKKIFNNTKVKIEFLTGKTEPSIRKKITKDLEKGNIDLIIGTHSLFQKKIKFSNLGLVIIDEQHKFGVQQRSELANKGGVNCDLLLLSATPIPRTMMMSFYGDMDVSKITEKPAKRKKIITLSKPENKTNEIWPLIKKKIKNNEQVFWVCPLIEESSFLDYTSAKKKFNKLNQRYPNKVGLIHGSLDKIEKEKVLNKFLKKEILILVSTTVIEVGIDFPDATLIIIENSNKFGLAQLHQLRGRVGRGSKESICILLFKKGLSKNAIKRIKILKKSDDGFYIAEKDMELRGFGDIIGFQQSGLKNFKFANPVIHSDLFLLAEKYIKKIQFNINDIKYSFLLKLFDKADIINRNID